MGIPFPGGSLEGAWTAGGPWRQDGVEGGPWPARLWGAVRSAGGPGRRGGASAGYCSDGEIAAKRWVGTEAGMGGGAWRRSGTRRGGGRRGGSMRCDLRRGGWWKSSRPPWQSSHSSPGCNYYPGCCPSLFPFPGPGQGGINEGY